MPAPVPTTTHPAALAGSTRRRTGPAVRTGLILAALLAIGDVVAGIATISGDAVGTAIAVFGGVAALVTLAALPAGWRGAEWALRTVAATRLLGALTAVPAFFVGDVPAALVIAAAVTVVLAVLVAVLVLRPARDRA